MSVIKAVLRYGYAPVFFTGFIGLAVLLVERGLMLWTLPLLLLAAIAVSFLAEHVLPYEPEWNRDQQDSTTNVLHALVNEASIFVSVLALPLIAAHIPGLEIWPHAWPLWLQLCLAIIIADFGITLTHFASHRYGWLWRLHAVHHAAPRLYGFNGLMKHPLHQALELTAGTTPLVIMGFGTSVAWLLSFAVAIQLLLQHSNVDMRIGRLGYLWAVAPAHRHHHIASAEDGNVNFGLFTSLWDHLLGTFILTQRRTPRAGELGVEGEADFPRGYAAHLLAPFTRRTPVLHNTSVHELT
jgi:sterol desaturase/sphingolipid hydroxylase (fatty acid hydroxylase superfamily)